MKSFLEYTGYFFLSDLRLTEFKTQNKDLERQRRVEKGISFKSAGVVLKCIF
jgi:hypothetical protein